VFRTDSSNSDSSPKTRLGGHTSSICYVAPAGAGVGKVMATAEALIAAGWHAHILCCGATDTELRACRRAACTTSRLNAFTFPDTLTLQGPHFFPALLDSDRVYHALQQLHTQHRFDVIEFAERGGLGFRTIQAKQTGQAFADVKLTVTAIDLTSALRHSQQEWLCNPEDLTLDYAERYALQYADRSPSLDSLASASGSAPLVTVCVPYFNLGDFLEETLSSLAAQSYTNLEVLVINDGSTDAHALDVFSRMQTTFPQFRFLDQANAGIGATRNRGLQLARGQYFLPVDADNIAHPDMVRRFVAGLEHNRDIAALTCYFLAFREFADLAPGRFAYAYRPTGGPRILGCLQNIYGDGNAMFRTEALRAVGGFETDRDTSFEDWEAFVKLVNAGRRVEVLPDFLFYYRHRDAGFSRVTNAYRNQQRVLRRFVEMTSWSEDERRLLWNWLVGSQQRLAELEAENRALTTKLASRRYRVADGLKRAIKRVMTTTKSLAGY